MDERQKKNFQHFLLREKERGGLAPPPPPLHSLISGTFPGSKLKKIKIFVFVLYC